MVWPRHSQWVPGANEQTPRLSRNTLASPHRGDRLSSSERRGAGARSSLGLCDLHWEALPANWSPRGGCEMTAPQDAQQTGCLLRQINESTANRTVWVALALLQMASRHMRSRRCRWLREPDRHLRPLLRLGGAGSGPDESNPVHHMCLGARCAMRIAVWLRTGAVEHERLRGRTTPETKWRSRGLNQG